MTIDAAKCTSQTVTGSEQEGPSADEDVARTSQATGASAIIATDAASDAIRWLDSPVSGRQVQPLNDDGFDTRRMFAVCTSLSERLSG